MKKFKLIETDDVKILRSEKANYNFCKKTGYTELWGSTKEEEILFSEIGPFILDIEVTTICNHFCKFCYKNNTKNGTNMSYQTFTKIFDNINKTKVLTQIAIGCDANCTTNPEIFDMMKYSRDNGVIPNITVAKISDEVAEKLSKVCGAVSVSRYANKNDCYDSIKKLTDLGMKQVNIHQLVSLETKDMIWETLNDYKNDPRLSKMNAIVFLTLKKKGRGETYHSLPKDEYEKIINYVMENNIPVGFDSCGAGKFLNAVKDYPNYDKLLEMSQPCESTRESFYVDVDGKAFPCSFCPNTESFSEGLDVVNCENFVDEVWNHPRTIAWRNHLLKTRDSGCFDCPVFEI